MKTCSTAFQVIAIMITLLSNKWSTKLSTIAGKLDDVSICTSTTKSVPRDFSLIENYKMVYYMAWKLSSQFLIFNPWKYPWNWIAFYQNSFVISPGLLCHLIRRDSGRLPNRAFTSNPIVSSKQWLNGSKIANCLERVWLLQKNPFCYNNFLVLNFIMVSALYVVVLYW